MNQESIGIRINLTIIDVVATRIDAWLIIFLNLVAYWMYIKRAGN
jgi:hypothetical protein